MTMKKYSMVFTMKSGKSYNKSLDAKTDKIDLLCEGLDEQINGGGWLKVNIENGQITKIKCSEIESYSMHEVTNTHTEIDNQLDGYVEW